MRVKHVDKTLKTGRDEKGKITHWGAVSQLRHLNLGISEESDHWNNWTGKQVRTGSLQMRGKFFKKTPQIGDL